MSLSIDGYVHEGTLLIKYGEDFPEEKRSIEVYSETYGKMLIYVIWLGKFEWTNRLEVLITYRYYITQIIEPVNEKGNHLRLV